MKESKINHIIAIALKGIGLAMGIATVVLSIVGDLESGTAITMLAIGLTCLGIAALHDGK